MWDSAISTNTLQSASKHGHTRVWDSAISTNTLQSASKHGHTRVWDSAISTNTLTRQSVGLSSTNTNLLKHRIWDYQSTCISIINYFSQHSETLEYDYLLSTPTGLNTGVRLFAINTDRIKHWSAGPSAINTNIIKHWCATICNQHR